MGFKVARIENVFLKNDTDYLDNQIYLLAKFKVVCSCLCLEGGAMLQAEMGRQVFARKRSLPICIIRL